MFYYLHHLGSLVESLSYLRLFRYITFRACGAALTAFLVTLLLGPFVIKLLKRLQATAPGHMDGVLSTAELDRSKDKVPTMGGALILFGIVVAILLWAIPHNSLVQVFLGLLVSLGLVGFIDDFRKVVAKSKAGLPGKWKLFFQVLIGLVSVWCLNATPETGDNMTKLMVPLLKDPLIENMALWIALAFSCTVVVASSNAVNLSDGMDGLAIGCVIICTFTYACFAYFCGHKYFALYLQIPHISGASEVVVIATAIIGAGLGFLWHNCYPAAMFMGDTGSLSIGGAIGLIAVLVKQELLLLIVGGVFVAEAGSVILQVSWFKLSRRLYGEPRRLFRCAPIHHHFQKAGWKETQVVIRFWIIALLLGAVGLATLKIR